jgi:hypothetical protein
MPNTEDCLPGHVRTHYIRVRSQKDEDARASYRNKLADLRAEAARGTSRSGHQELAEWKLAEEFIGKLAYGKFEAAIETCSLYDIGLDQRLCGCLENSIREYIVAQYRNSLRLNASRLDGARIPLSAKTELAARIQGCRFAVFNAIQIDLEKARIAGERKTKLERQGRKDNMPRTLTPEEMTVLRALSKVYPRKLSLDEIAPLTSFLTTDKVLLQAVDDLSTRQFIDCVPIRDSAGLVYAANIILSASGVAFLDDSSGNENVQRRTPAMESSEVSRKKLRTAVVLNALIASPSDVSEEREIAANAVYAWNAAHRSTTGIILQPIRWETHSFPASGARPQAIINKQIVNEGDFLIGIFGNRIGTPTGEAQSGTIEEIELFRKAGKHVSLYFSTADVPRSTEYEQLRALGDYQRERQKDTLFATFATPEELRQLITQHLPPIVSDVYKRLRSSHELEGLEEELRSTESRSEQRLSELAAQVKEPLRVDAEFVGEDPDHLRLQVTTNRHIVVTQLDYLDERDVRIASETMQLGGQNIEIPIQQTELVKIFNLKPRSGHEAIPMGFRLHILEGTSRLKQKIPAALEQTYKMIDSALTVFFKVLG